MKYTSIERHCFVNDNKTKCNYGEKYILCFVLTVNHHE